MIDKNIKMISKDVISSFIFVTPMQKGTHMDAFLV
jgi:hypothetical protein